MQKYTEREVRESFTFGYTIGVVTGLVGAIILTLVITYSYAPELCTWFASSHI